MLDFVDRGFSGLMSSLRDAFAARSVREWPVPMSPTAHLDPVVTGLSPDYLSPRPQKRAEDYVFIRTIAERFGVSTDKIERLQESYRSCVPDSRIFISGVDEFPGLKRAILLGANWSASVGFGRVFIGITHDGLLFHRFISREAAHDSTGQTLDVIRNTPEAIEYHASSFNLGLNPRFPRAQGDAREPTWVVYDAMRAGDRYGAISPLFYNVLFQYMQKQFNRRLNRVRWAILDAIDPDILRTMRSVATMDLEFAEWLSGCEMPASHSSYRGLDRWFGCSSRDFHDREKSRIRRQAVAAYPALGRYLPQLTSVIDERAPLAPAVASLLEVSEKSVKAIQGLSWQKAAITPSSPFSGLGLIMSVPTQLRPKTRGEYRQLPAINEFSRVLRLSFADVLRRFAVGGSPYRFARELAGTTASDVEDAASYVVDKLLMPARLHAVRARMERDPSLAFSTMWFEKQRRDMVASFLNALSPKDMFSLSERWHRNLARHEERIVTLQTDCRWSALVERVDCGRGIAARELASIWDLKFQGRREHHCVGGYADKILKASKKGFTLVFSLECEDSVVSTLEVCATRATKKLSAGSKSWSFYAVQNRARRNGVADKNAVRAAGLLLRRLNALPECAIEAYLDAISRLGKRRNLRLSRQLQTAGFDIWNRGELERAFDELCIYLPRAHRKAGLDALIEHQGACVDFSSRDFACPSRFFRSESSSTRPFWEVDYNAVAALRAVSGIDNGDSVGEAVEEIHAAQEDYDHIEIDF